MQYDALTVATFTLQPTTPPTESAIHLTVRPMINVWHAQPNTNNCKPRSARPHEVSFVVVADVRIGRELVTYIYMAS